MLNSFISGAHLNPAVTLAMVTVKKLKPIQVRREGNNSAHFMEFKNVSQPWFTQRVFGGKCTDLANIYYKKYYFGEKSCFWHTFQKLYLNPGNLNQGQKTFRFQCFHLFKKVNLIIENLSYFK